MDDALAADGTSGSLQAMRGSDRSSMQRDNRIDLRLRAGAATLSKLWMLMRQLLNPTLPTYAHELHERCQTVRWKGTQGCPKQAR